MYPCCVLCYACLFTFDILSKTLVTWNRIISSSCGICVAEPKSMHLIYMMPLKSIEVFKALTVPRGYFCCYSSLLLVLGVRIYTLVHLLCA